MTALPAATVAARRLSLRNDAAAWGTRTVPEETAVALTYNRASYAVMMATPRDLEDFGIGFSLSEGVIENVDEITAMETVPLELGIEIRMELAPSRAGRTLDRSRRVAGPAGCGLCGVESLKEAIRPLPRVASSFTVSRQSVHAAVDALSRAQALNHATGALHAAGFWTDSMTLVREDVGRHNALDKLAGALARGQARAACGIVVLSSRVSVEMVQKAAMIGVPAIVAVSAPTALAIRTAETAGITLIAIARADGFEVFSGAERVTH